MYRRLYLITIFAVLSLLLGSSVLAVKSNYPSCWVTSVTGVSIDTNCDGVVDVSTYSIYANTVNISNIQQFNYTASINAINSTLNLEILNRITNDTYLLNLINLVNATISAQTNYSQYVNISNVQSLNDTAFINLVNTTLDSQKLDKTDQRYNESAAVTSLNNTKYDKTGGTITGDVLINGNLSVTGNYVNLTVTNVNSNGNLKPGTNNTYALGSPTLLWSAGYFDTLYGKIDYSYIQNVPWLVATDQRYNDTVAIGVVSSNLNIEINNRQTNDSLLQGQINALNISSAASTNFSQYTNISNAQSLNDTAAINNVTGGLANETIARQDNDTLLQNNINTKLNIVDQRYNDTLYIGAVNTTANIQGLGFNTTAQLDLRYIQGNVYYNTSQIDSKLDLKLNVTDQRYNDTASINNVASGLANETLNRQGNDTANTNLINAVNTTLNIQGLSFYNVSQVNSLISSINSTGNFINYYNKTESDARFYSINNPYGFYNSTTIPAYALQTSLLSVGNWTADKVNYNTTAQNSNLYLAIGDQRYNDTASINNVASGLANETLNRQGNDTFIQTSVTGNASLLTNEILARQSVGNWTADKPSYNTTAQLNTLYPTQAQLNATNSNVTLLQTAVSGNASALTNEISNRQTNDTAINSRIDSVNSSLNTEITSRQGNNTAIGLRIDSLNSTKLQNGSSASLSSLIITGNTTLTNINSTGNISFLDNAGQVRHLGNIATHISEMQSYTLLDASRSTLTNTAAGLNYTLTATNGCGQWNFNGTIYPNDGTCVTSVSITLLNGSNTNPKTNYVHFYLNAGVPTITTTEAYPSYAHIDVASFIVGNANATSSTIYAYNRNRYEINDFVESVLERFENMGTLYVSGFTTTSSTTQLNISNGDYFGNNVFEFETTNKVSIANGFYFINSTGQFVQATSLANLTQYADGTAFSGTNERVNIVWGIIATNVTGSTGPTQARLVAVLPTYPGAGNTYQSVANAIADGFDTLNYYPPNAVVKGGFVPIARTILRPNTDVNEPFATGIFHKFIAGSIGSSGASPIASSNNHATLDNLDYSTAAHTGFASQTGLDTKLNATDQRYNDTAAIALKANIDSPSFSGNVTVNGGFTNTSGITLSGGDYWGTGNIFVKGNITAVNVNYVNTNVSNSTSATTFFENGTALINKYLTIGDQRYNNTGINTTLNIQGLGFNTTTQLSTLYYSVTNPNSYYNITTIPAYDLITSVNAKISSIGNWTADKASYNTTTQLNTLYYGISNPNAYYNSTTIPSYALNTKVDSLGNWSADKASYNTTAQNNNIYLTIGDQRYNNTGINTTLNIQGLGFNTTTQLSTYFNLSYATITSLGSVNNTANAKAGTGSCAAGQFVNGTNTSGVICATVVSATLTGSGVANTLTKWTNRTNLGNSSITDDGTTVTVGMGTQVFEVNATGLYTTNITSTGTYTSSVSGISTLFNVQGNIDSFTEVNIKNTNNGSSASSDFVATSNIGNATDYYVDLGINSNNYSNAAYNITGANDAYLYSQGGNLAISAATATKTIKFSTGGTTDNKLRMSINDTSVNIQQNMTIGSTVGQISFGNGGGYSWNSTDSCLVSPANTTNSRQILCVTKPSG